MAWTAARCELAKIALQTYWLGHRRDGWSSCPTAPCPLVTVRFLKYNACRLSELQPFPGGGNVQLRVTDVEQLKKKVRKLAASQVLAGGGADVCLDLGQVAGCRARIAAGYGSLSKAPQSVPQDRLLWILDGHVDVHDTGGQVTSVSQGESTVLTGGTAYRLVFPQLTLYLNVEATDKG
jgi:hypothetical protein